MSIKKLGLVSTIAVLSVTISLGGCDNTKPKAAESAAKVAEVAKAAADKKAADEAEEARVKAEEARVSRRSKIKS
ncbi:hypothetical protein CKC_05700 [Candidatus Liberibacter solanacearum CLso-ZC1]|uniref:Lipoprotein n=1 Tax=Liberibacter solanacearum (strain CLso-ZC1) TaxID=658172 RepID=E4UE57_LIBSC|nr:small effector proten [Candidatus Liberibacter solanacearum]ADR52885.1 hypothetical protein CKC_05700 [Candidatus Liberibacter solanacearum CLso-ZC1]